MKIPSKSPSRFLGQEDVASPIVATMSHVTQEVLKSARGQDTKFILHFSTGAPKPLKMNITNQKCIIALYGDESESWRGRQIEIYWEPSVVMGNETVGGVRVRLPATTKPDSTTTQPLSQQAVAEKHAKVLTAYRAAKTVAFLDQCYARADTLPFTPEQHEEQLALYQQRLAELAPPALSLHTPAAKRA